MSSQHQNSVLCWFFCYFVDAYPSFDPMLDGRKEIAKYNRFMDEIFTRMNIAIKAKQLDPMDLKLLPTNSDKVPRSGAIYDNVQKVRFSFKIHLGVFLTIWYFTGQSLVTWHVNLKTNWWCLHILSCRPQNNTMPVSYIPELQNCTNTTSVYRFVMLLHTCSI